MIIDIEVNNKTIKATKGETILSALQQNGIQVPTLCHMKELFPTGACRMCVVEVEGEKNLIPSCSYPVDKWMRIKTHSPRVIKARKTLVELLLSNHPDDCLYCIRNGNCELQSLADNLTIHERRFVGKKNTRQIDKTSESIVREPEKCILCERCVRFCEEILHISALNFIGRGSDSTIGPEFNNSLSKSSCIDCGQCTLLCPSGALHEKSNFNSIIEALHNPSTHVIAIYDGALISAIGEEFDIKSGKNINKILNSTLKLIGFNKIFDASFGNDLYITEVSNQIIENINNNINRPIISTHCPSWVKYVDKNIPEARRLFTSVKPPQELLGTIIKDYYAKKNNIPKEDIFIVSLNSCTAKKDEIVRPIFYNNAIRNIDASLTTRELGAFIKLHDIQINQMSESLCDTPFGISSSSGKISSISGGLTEAIARTLYHMSNGKHLQPARVNKLRNSRSFKELIISLNKKRYRMIAVDNLLEAKALVKDALLNDSNILFIEVNICPYGCVNGGGQPLNTDEDTIKARKKCLYDIDNKDFTKTTYSNSDIISIYNNYLNKPGSKKSKELLHEMDQLKQ